MHNVVITHSCSSVQHVARRHVIVLVSNLPASSFSTSRSVTKQVAASRLEADVRIWYFLSNLLPFVENVRSSSSGRNVRLTNMLFQKPSKRRESPQVTSMSDALCKTGRCLVEVVLFARLHVLVFAECSPRGSDRDPTRQTETWKYAPCVTSPSDCKTNWKFQSNILSMEFTFNVSVFFYFFFFTFLETGKVTTQPQPPPPPNGHARILANADIYGPSLSYRQTPSHIYYFPLCQTFEHFWHFLPSQSASLSTLGLSRAFLPTLLSSSPWWLMPWTCHFFWLCFSIWKSTEEVIKHNVIEPTWPFQWDCSWKVHTTKISHESSLRGHLISSQFFSKRNAFRNGGRG